MSADSPGRPERCTRQRQRLSLQVDGELPHGEQLLLQAHLARCTGCRAFRAELSGVTDELRSTALARADFAIETPQPRLRARPTRLAPTAGLAVVGLAVITTGLLRAGHARVEIGALNPAQGFPVYSTPYRLEGLPVYTRPSAQFPTTAS